MARFKRKAKRSISRLFSRKSSRKSSGTSNPLSVVIPSAVYGASRAYLSSWLTPITSRVPLGNYADEAVLGTIAYFVAKKTTGLPRQIAMSALTIESASLGAQLASGMMVSTSSNKAVGMPIN